jgi:hypothetical protein
MLTDLPVENIALSARDLDFFAVKPNYSSTASLHSIFSRSCNIICDYVSQHSLSMFSKIAIWEKVKRND